MVSRTITKREEANQGGSKLPRGPNYEKVREYQENEFHLACTHTKKQNSPFSHILCYTNNIHNNNHKSQQNKHKIKDKRGRV
jgi:hypothetical protein